LGTTLLGTAHRVQGAASVVGCRACNSLQFPMAFPDLRLPGYALDVNVTPDKRKVLLHSEALVLSALRDALHAHYSPSSISLQVTPTPLPSQGPAAPRHRVSPAPPAPTPGIEAAGLFLHSSLLREKKRRPERGRRRRAWSEREVPRLVQREGVGQPRVVRGQCRR